MDTPQIILLSVAFSILLLLFVLVVRALLFKPRREEDFKSEPVFFDADKAVNDLCDMIRCRTVSDKLRENEDEAEFLKFKELLPELFPEVFKTCVLETPSDRSILLKWQGKSSVSPTVLMAHYDVVSVVEEKWEKPPFSGEIDENGVIWGRGAIDTKITLNGILEAAQTLIKSGFIPENDVYFAFAGDEEVNGYGARAIVKLFQERGITPGIVVDEGGAVVNNVFPGVSTPCALVGIAEKGMVNIEYSVNGGGGHASSPKPHTPIGKLSEACVRMEKNPFKLRLCDPTKKLFDTLGRYSTFLYRIIFSNLWLFKPVLNILTKKTGGELNALMRPTTAFTMMEGSRGMNVIPAYASMISNHRIIPGETVDSVVETIKATAEPAGVSVRLVEGTDPSVISKTDCDAYERVVKAIKGTWNGVLVSPYLMVACSDSRHWGVVSDCVYRFSAMALSAEERATIHGNNERVPVKTVAKTVEFYIRLLSLS